MLANESRATGPLAPDLARASWQLWLVFALVAIAALVRFAGVHDLSFYGDEETTAFAAASVLDSGKPAVPSGMDYNRAPLYSYMAAASASVLGESRELSYRLPALLFGILTVMVLWFCTRRLFGVAVALVATTLLATSEWHAVTSGYARMYSPYLAFFLCTAYCFVEWGRARAPAMLATGVVLFLVSASFQILTVFAVALLLLPHFVSRQLHTRHLYFDAAVAVVLAVGAIYFDSKLVQGAYSEFATSVGGNNKSTVIGNVALFWLPLLQQALGGWTLVAAGASLLGACYLLWRYLPWYALPWNLAVYGLCLLGTLLMVLGQVYALGLCLYLLLVLATAKGFSLTRSVTVALPAVGVAVVAAALSQTTGFIDYLTNPNQQLVFPYLAQLFVKYPVLVGLALVAPFVAGHRLGAESMTLFRHGEEFTSLVVRSLALFCVLNLFAFGLFGRWYEDRYVVHTYPFMLVLASYTLIIGLAGFNSIFSSGSAVLPGSGRPRNRPMLPVVIAGVILCVLMPHHLLQGAWNGAMREHGDTNIENGRYFPDHASAGQYVRDRLRPGDTVVATDVLQQRWYVGQADYWLRSAKDVAIYVYRGTDGRVRDIYVNAEFLGARHAAELLASDNRVWVIVSSIDVDEEWAFSTAEREFLDAVKRSGSLEHTGRDKRSKVYLLGGEA